MLGGLPAEQGAAGPTAPFGDPLDDRGDPLGLDPARPRGSRGRTGARRRCTRRRRRTSPRGRCPTVSSRPVARAISSLVPTPSVAAASSVPSPMRNSPANPPTSSATSGRLARAARSPIRVTAFAAASMSTPARGTCRSRAAPRDTHAVGSRSWSSSTNLPTRSGTSIGYSPSKHARQNDSFGPPAAATMPSSER